MKHFKLFKAYTIFLVLILLLSCQQKQQQQVDSFIPNQDSIGNWLLSEKIAAFSLKLNETNEFSKTGLSKKDYLKIIEGQVKVMQQFQDSSGKIIDPVEKEEKYYTTPCYAHSVAVLASTGFTKDTKLIESGMKALDNTCEHLKRQFAPGNHGDFYTYPVMLAIKHFESFADSTRLNNWKKIAKEIRPEKFYAFYGKYHINWNLVHSAGEFLRYKEGFVDINYVDTSLQMQKNHFTDYGMYNEWGNPLAYDLFSRHYLAGIMAMGYKGTQLKDYEKILWKGAWMSLFMQSPTGELPTGYRSSQHIWNEAEQAMLFEIYAQQYLNTGNNKLAGVFKRGAMLSLKNIKEWIRPDGSGYIVKNKFPIESKHGYERYSVHSCYNMLATSMLAQAYEFAADIDEQVSPADVGGYVLPVLDPFHKIIANSNGTYLEYDTKGDQKYNPTGILRIHLKDTKPQLGPSDGIASIWNEEGTSISLGPCWQNTDGSWTSLAQQKVKPEKFEILEETENKVGFNLIYKLSDSIFVSENISIENNIVTVTNKFEGILGKKKITWPVMVFDGETKTNIKLGNQFVLLTYNEDGIQLKFDQDLNTSVQLSEKEYNHRNGIFKIAEIEFEANEFTYTLSVK